jgi:hypothetical protein
MDKNGKEFFQNGVLALPEHRRQELVERNGIFVSIAS